jgi:hypothetical protein
MKEHGSCIAVQMVVMPQYVMLHHVLCRFTVSLRLTYPLLHHLRTHRLAIEVINSWTQLYL